MVRVLATPACEIVRIPEQVIGKCHDPYAQASSRNAACSDSLLKLWYGKTPSAAKSRRSARRHTTFVATSRRRCLATS